MDVFNKQIQIEKLNCDRKYQLLSGGCQEIILFFNFCGYVIDANQVAKKELGYDKNIIGIKIVDIFKKAFTTSNNFIEKIQGTNNECFETFAYRKNDSCFPVNLRICIEGKGMSMMGLCVAINISDTKEVKRDLTHARSQAEAAINIKNEFIANVTHELRTPVNGIMGLTSNLLETELSKSQKDIVNIINKCCHDMAKNINNLLDLSKITAGKLTIENQEFDFKQFINNIIAFNSNLINKKGLKFIYDLGDDIPNRLIGDEMRLTQVLHNLFSNAVKFTSEGCIAFEVTKTMITNNEIELVFFVIDTGIGIDETDKDKLFQNFSQVDGTITRRFGGTGLGLAICKELVNLMGGSISVISEKGKGSIFTFGVRLAVIEGDSGQDALHLLNQNTFLNTSAEENFSLDLEGYMHDNISTIMDLEKKFMRSINKKDIISLIERLALCIEMDNWEKAENLAITIKNNIDEKDTERRKAAFRLELAVRKEDGAKSRHLLNILTELMRR